MACGGTNALPVHDIEPAWLIAARSAGASADDDPCDFTNPTYATLGHLNIGMAESPEAVIRAVEETPELHAIRTTDVGNRWLYAHQADLTSDVGVQTMLREHPGWTQLNALIPETLEFSEPNGVTRTRYMGGISAQTGTWRVQDGAVHIEISTETWVLAASRGAFFVALDGSEHTWAMNPSVCL